MSQWGEQNTHRLARGSSPTQACSFMSAFSCPLGPALIFWSKPSKTPTELGCSRTPPPPQIPSALHLPLREYRPQSWHRGPSPRMGDTSDSLDVFHYTEYMHPWWKRGSDNIPGFLSPPHPTPTQTGTRSTSIPSPFVLKKTPCTPEVLLGWTWTWRNKYNWKMEVLIHIRYLLRHEIN